MFYKLFSFLVLDRFISIKTGIMYKSDPDIFRYYQSDPVIFFISTNDRGLSRIPPPPSQRSTEGSDRHQIEGMACARMNRWHHMLPPDGLSAGAF